MRILLVEDEIQLAKSLKKILEHNNYTVDMIHNGLDVISFITTYNYDIILLDVMLPGLDGVSALKKIREINSFVKIIMLTAKDLVSDKVLSLDLGADDYITKPFSSTELLARIRSSLRRKDTTISTDYFFEDISLDIKTCVLKNKNGEFQLGKKEFKIMKLLLENKNQILSQEILFNYVWDSESSITDGVLWTYISYLRKKLRVLDSKVSIKASRGIGYSLEVML